MREHRLSPEGVCNTQLMHTFSDPETREQAITFIWYGIHACQDIEVVNEAFDLIAKFAADLDESTVDICKAFALERWEAEELC